MNRPPAGRIISEEAAALHRRAFVIDLHTDSLITAQVLGRDLSKSHRPPAGFQPWMLHADVPRMKEGGLNAVFLGIVTHPWPHGAIERARRNLRYGRYVIKKNSESLGLATSPDEIKKLNKSGKIAVLFGVEGMHMLSGRLESVKELYDLGARYISLAHFTSNAFATSSADPFKREVNTNRLCAAAVELMNSLGMIVDLAHAHTGLIGQVCKATRAPVIVSHGATKALRPTFRNLSDEDIFAVAATGGVIGIIYATQWLGMKGADVHIGSIVDHADHVRKLVGVDHLALGSDWDGFIATPPELPDVAALPTLTQEFLDRGWSSEEVEKILGLNFMRVFRQVCGSGP
ncbi:MAG: dipeptidase [Candidatus Geothermincolia bacterium]